MAKGSPHCYLGGCNHKSPTLHTNIDIGIDGKASALALTYIHVGKASVSQSFAF